LEMTLSIWEANRISRAVTACWLSGANRNAALIWFEAKTDNELLQDESGIEMIMAREINFRVQSCVRRNVNWQMVTGYIFGSMKGIGSPNIKVLVWPFSHRDSYSTSWVTHYEITASSKQIQSAKSKI
jgi:hypothetical protein